MSEKKASEIILELRDQVKHLTRLVSNQDNNIKIILKKLNNLELSKPSPKVSDYYISENSSSEPRKSESKFLKGNEALEAKAEHARQQTSQFEVMAQQAGVESEPSLGSNGTRSNHLVLSETKEFSGQVRGRRVDRESKQNPISVTQLVLGHDGKPLPLATVRITNRLGQTVKSSRSNTKGRWSAPLIPGEYNISISKNKNSPNKKPVEMEFSVQVIDNGTGKMEIPSPDTEG